MSEDIERVSIEERGGRRYPVGTIYYSKKEQAFLRAGSEELGPLSVGEVSGHVTWEFSKLGDWRFRDETGVYFPLSSFHVDIGLNFSSRFLKTQEEFLESMPWGEKAGPQSEYIERFLVTGEDGRLHVVEVSHGIGGEFDPQAQGKQWWRKMAEAFEEATRDMSPAEKKEFYRFLMQNIMHYQVILRTNLGPAI
jgi:hypothetical protein